MRNPSHKTLIGTIRTLVYDWRKAQDWSRETVFQVMVEAHEQIGGPVTTGIVFDPKTRDTFDRSKVNADRISRWLDDDTKDNNLLPANFLPSILAAMPMDLRLQCLGDILRPLGVEVRSSEAAEGGAFDAHTHVSAIIKESAEAARAVLSVGSGASMDALESACKEVRDVQEASTTTLRALHSAMGKSDARVADLVFRAA